MHNCLPEGHVPYPWTRHLMPSPLPIRIYKRRIFSYEFSNQERVLLRPWCNTFGKPKLLFSKPKLHFKNLCLKKHCQEEEERIHSPSMNQS